MMPMPTQVGRELRHDDEMSFAYGNDAVAPGAHVFLRCLVGLDSLGVDVVVGPRDIAHSVTGPPTG